MYIINRQKKGLFFTLQKGLNKDRE